MTKLPRREADVPQEASVDERTGVGGGAAKWDATTSQHKLRGGVEPLLQGLSVPSSH